VIKDLEEIG